MSTCVQVFFYTDFPMATKERLKTFCCVATEVSFRWFGKAVSQVIDVTIYIKVHKNARGFMATLICHKTRISPISSVGHALSVGHAKGGLAMQYSSMQKMSLYQHKSDWNKVPVQNIAPPSVQKPSSKVPYERQFIIGSKEKFLISSNISYRFVGKFCSLCYGIYIKL